MTELRRGPWFEVELPNHEGELLMACPGWTNDPATLVLPIREAGWFATSGEVFDAVSNAVLTWIWMGETDDLELVECSWEGLALGSGENVNDVRQVTLASVAAPRRH